MKENYLKERQGTAEGLLQGLMPAAVHKDLGRLLMGL